ncbi:SWPV1-097 [Shearwaterpox virus]|uniref:Metalloendopeptidase n=1 Tax=Shearwaterpox virus TaxID=1974596 RepID=A0A1V0S806_CNPV|nr:SWPV1-097 [Shearwaterpox virus]
MIILYNGVRIFVNHSMRKDIYIGISDFGFEKDIQDDVLGIAHLLEHILISFDNKYFDANATTSRTYMSFWCESLYKNHYLDAIKTAISWFFDKQGILRTDFSKVILENYVTELENEYYYRTEMYHCMDILAYLYGGDLYNGGRITMLDRLNEIRKLLSNRMKRLAGRNIVIFVKRLNYNIMEMLNKTFGTLPVYAELIPIEPYIQDAKNKIIMMPYPFYTILVQVDNTLNNLLAIICLVENYNLIDYETIGDKLYISISFADEDQYEYLLYNIKGIEFYIDKVELNLGEDYIMNLYINFPWLKKDIFEYVHTMTTNNKILIEQLKKDMYESISQHRFMVIYPSFTKSLYNFTDKQDHGLLVVGNVNFKINGDNTNKLEDSNSTDNTNESTCIIKINNKAKPKKNIFYKKSYNNNIVVSIKDKSFFKYAVFYHVIGNRMYTTNTLSRIKTSSGVCYKHCFSNEDLNELINSDTFIRYNSSKPAVLYQYILLTYFVTEKDIKDILGYKNQVLQLDTRNLGNNKIVFGKKTRYDIYTKSMFVCGLIKGRKLSERYMIDYMWKLKRAGLIYHLSYTKISTPNTYYIFTFTVFTEKVYKYLTNFKEITSSCLVVSNKNKKSEEDDYSSLNKHIIIDIK